ncbi:MAG TPA: YcxB family protein [Hyphomonas sp.]|nr:YcxB family protein [Hyphomonas sp.]MCA8905249.1 YcxB family protein [Hyphomonas sp.]MCB9970754.1 YcxB family protein [Hyphomonas sp.]HPE49129.1 YcxB family protein [Hyphomonas sp.]
MSEALTVSGLLTEKDVKKLTRLARGGTVGPTAVYYAGVTAPIISASMSVMVRNTLDHIGASPYWQWLIASLVAAFAGIAWYLIFIRWSYRHRHGRGNETTEETKVELQDQNLVVRRGGVEIRAAWSAVSDVSASRSHVTIMIDGADPLIIPNAWFGNDKAARKDFVARLNEKTDA